MIQVHYVVESVVLTSLCVADNIHPRWPFLHGKYFLFLIVLIIISPNFKYKTLQCQCNHRYMGHQCMLWNLWFEHLCAEQTVGVSQS